MLEAKLVRTQEERLIAEFKQKNEILQSKFMVINPFDFYFELFKSYDPDLIYVSGDKKTYNRLEKTGKAFDTESLLLHYAQFRNDVYIPLATFYRGHYKTSTLKELFAFVVDLDGMTPLGLNTFLKYTLRGIELKPNYIVNSGKGVHLYYVLKEPFQVYRKYLSNLKEINSSLQSKMTTGKNNYVVDKHSIIQSYRMVGTYTKFDQTVSAYKIQEKHYNISELASFANVNLGSKSNKKRSEVSEQMAKGNIEIFPNAKSGFYDYMGARIFHEVDYGTRYMSMFALAVVAWKARIPRSRLEEDLWELQAFWNESRSCHERISDKEIEKALKGYNTKSTLVTSKKLEEWTGFEFKRAKRNGRKRQEHLGIISAKKRGGNKEIVKRYAENNPFATQRQMAKDSSNCKCLYSRFKKASKYNVKIEKENF